jgi:hypothetical protein
MKESQSNLPGLIGLISQSIEKSGRCTFRDMHLLDFPWGVTDDFETKIRRLRLFARQHQWMVTSHFGRTAVFTRGLNYLMPI